MDIKSYTDAGDIVIMDGDEIEYQFKCKPNFFTDQLLAEHGIALHDLFVNGKGNNATVRTANRLVADMSRNGDENGEPLLTAEEVEEKVDPLTVRGCVMVALGRYAEMLEKFHGITSAVKKKAKG